MIRRYRGGQPLPESAGCLLQGLRDGCRGVGRAGTDQIRGERRDWAGRSCAQAHSAAAAREPPRSRPDQHAVPSGVGASATHCDSGQTPFYRVVLFLIVAGGSGCFGKSTVRSPGPLKETVSAPPRTECWESRLLHAREVVGREVRLLRRVFASEKNLIHKKSELRYQGGEYLFPTRPEKAVGKRMFFPFRRTVVQHQLTFRPHRRPDRPSKSSRGCCEKRRSLRQHQGVRGKAAVTRQLPFQPRLHARAGAPTQAPGDRAAGARSMGSPHPDCRLRPPDQLVFSHR